LRVCRVCPVFLFYCRYMAIIRESALKLWEERRQANLQDNAKWGAPSMGAVTVLKYETLLTGMPVSIFKPIVWTEAEAKQMMAAAVPYSKARGAAEKATYTHDSEHKRNAATPLMVRYARQHLAPLHKALDAVAIKG